VSLRQFDVHLTVVSMCRVYPSHKQSPLICGVGRVVGDRYTVAAIHHVVGDRYTVAVIHHVVCDRYTVPAIHHVVGDRYTAAIHHRASGNYCTAVLSRTRYLCIKMLKIPTSRVHTENMEWTLT